MKNEHLKWLGTGFLLALLVIVGIAAVPAFTDFNINQFSTSGNKVSIKSGVLLTNAFNNGVAIGTGGGGVTFGDLPWTNAVVTDDFGDSTPLIYPNISTNKVWIPQGQLFLGSNISSLTGFSANSKSIVAVRTNESFNGFDFGLWGTSGETYIRSEISANPGGGSLLTLMEENAMLGNSYVAIDANLNDTSIIGYNKNNPLWSLDAQGLGTFYGGLTAYAASSIPTNTASFSTVAPADLHNVALGKGWTNDLGARADLVMSVKYTDAVSGDPALAFTNTITGEAWTNNFAFGIVGSIQQLVTIPDLSPNDYGSFTDRSGTGASVTILKAWWKLK